MKKTICIIPARAGSKRLKNKNTRPFAGKSLTILACEQAVRLKHMFEDIVFTSNDMVAIRQAADYDDIVIRKRPEELCTDSASSESAISDVLVWMGSMGRKYDQILLLEVTSPLRTDDDIVMCLEIAEDYHGVKSVTTVKNCLNGPVVEAKKQLNGAVHIWDVDHIYDVPYDRFGLYEMDPEQSFHIDYEWEFDCAEMIYKKGLS